MDTDTLQDWEIPPDIIETPAEMAVKGYASRLRPLDGKKLAYRESGPIPVVKLRHVIRRRCLNLGLRLHDGLVVVDKDGPDLGPFEDVVSPMSVRTSRGEHHYFRTDQDHKNRIHPDGLDVDVLFHGVVPLPPSINWETGDRYEWLGPVLRPEQLPLFPIEILRQFDPPPPTPVQRTAARRTAGHIYDVRAYVSRIVAVEGQGGDKATFRVACLLAQACGGDEQETLAGLREWNALYARPPWDDKDLVHKARCAVRTVR